MNYVIPEREKGNVISVFWQMLQQIEGQTNPEKDILDACLVKGGYDVLNRCGVTDARPRWERKEGA